MLHDPCPFAVALDNIRSRHNVGAIFRTADAAGVERLYLGGYTPAPPDPRIQKVSLGAEKTLPWQSVPQLWRLVAELKAAGTQIVALENNVRRAKSLWSFTPRPPLLLIVGNEITGVSAGLLKRSDAILEIPMLGAKESLNVSVAFGLAAFEISRKLHQRFISTDHFPKHPAINEPAVFLNVGLEQAFAGIASFFKHPPGGGIVAKHPGVEPLKIEIAKAQLGNLLHGAGHNALAPTALGQPIADLGFMALNVVKADAAHHLTARLNGKGNKRRLALAPLRHIVADPLTGVFKPIGVGDMRRVFVDLAAVDVPSKRALVARPKRPKKKIFCLKRW